MRTILIVDDEPRLLQSIEAGLKIHQNSFSVITSSNGEEAVAVLASNKIDLVITDLKMPKMDGFELLAYLSAAHPTIPAIVMTAFNTPAIEERIEESNSLKLLEKPIDFDELTNSIFETLERTAEEGTLRGISLTSFLQLLETEQKTCLIEVRSKEQKGYIYFHQGELYSAILDSIKGEEAVYAMLMFEDVEIKIKKQLKKKFKKTVGTPLFPVLMEGMRRKDEKGNKQEVDPVDPPPSSPDESGERSGPKDDKETPNQVKSTQQGDENMGKIEDTLAKLADVEGFLAAGVFTPNGEMAAQLNNSGLQLAELGSIANDVLLKAQKATDIMDVGRGQLIHIEAPKAHVLARCFNENTDFSATDAGKAHVHMVVILGTDGNLAMAKMKLASIIQEIAPAFR